ncbi:GNAT family N-acetyltransferase [Fictibacillus norfolkensis]|uniref:GNAT family N-acetyltransferase n=1 Tax=Fictibacillus norfolkensis TaxID=2762233 RepID=A0ABR8SJB6_9BACL|nr:GNAT family N-acetyltransferase [Fictibacillus norfolkensis]MBD7963560.1 GNAT family N-acetyltransferase [Fictibacillus norfolkensis]
MLEVVGTSKVDKKFINEFFQKHWGSAEMVLSSGTFKCDELDGFVAINEMGEIVGLVTNFIHNNVCENSILENIGIGTELLTKVEEQAYSQEVIHIRVTTTKDTLRALSFYQKRGYCLTDLFPNAVAKAREIKPEIPQVADNGIPIRDEIVLSKILQGSIYR